MFKIGQKVICIEDDSNYSPSYLKNNNIYTIKNIVKACNGTALLLEEIYNGNQYRDLADFWGWNPKRFEVLRYEIISNKEILKEIIIEKLDLPIKEPVLN